MIKWLRTCIILGSMVFFTGCSNVEWTQNIPFLRTPLPSQTIQTSPSTETPAVLTQTISQTITPKPEINGEGCDAAAAGVPFDVAIPDGSVMKPGDSFTKTWRLVNSGTCVWTNEYSIVWFYGDDIGVSRVKHLRQEVLPGETIDISMDMFAPNRAGVYHSYWKLKNAKGDMFGIGPKGDAPFWAHIEVIDETTPTYSSQPTVTPTRISMSTGEATLNIDEAIDLDDVEFNDFNDSDLFFLEDEEGNLLLEARNGAGLSLFSARIPTFTDCQIASYDIEVVDLQDISNNIYFCYTTSQGLPGFVKIATINSDEKYIQLAYQTWKVP